MNYKNSVRILMVLVLAGLAAACQKSEAPEPSLPYDPAPVADVPAVAPAPRSLGKMWLDPLATCGENQISTLHWDADLLSRGPVNIRFGEEVEGPLFGHVGEAGQKETGAWLKPGDVFVARAEDGTELARAVAAGPDCAE